jgi:hypothetical protein
MIARVFISKQNKRGREQGNGETDIYREGVRVQALGNGGSSVGCKPTVRKYTCRNKQNVQHLCRLSLISKMRNLTNGFAHG